MTSTATIGFCGLGQMGAPMAASLLAHGHDVAVWNRSTGRAGPLVEAGARAAESPADAAAGADAVVTMLSSAEALEEVLFGPSGVSDRMRPGAALIEMSTVGPAAIERVWGRLPEGVDLVDAPVLGSVPQAESGELAIFVGAEEGAFERWRPVLAAMGSPVRVGPRGSGAALKVVVNSTLVGAMSALGEALALADGLGLDEAVVLDVLARSPLGVTVGRKRDAIASGAYPPNFKLALARKDARLVAEAARDSGVELRVGASARSWFDDADEAGCGALDYSAVIAHIRGRPARG
ncbi:MAG TPA: NAD(P)-dependent oxidoreductase [Actinomycetota bacterium]|nr:NAD(P)-dependent oxidoreductase [Actinomycetota bacterium]